MGTKATLARKLDSLFEAAPARGGPYTVDEVARATGISVSYLRYLRSGERDNPTRRMLTALATFFGVDPSYLIADDADSSSPPCGGTAASEIARQVRDLPPESLEVVRDVIAAERSKEGLPVVGPATATA